MISEITFKSILKPQYEVCYRETNLIFNSTRLFMTVQFDLHDQSQKTESARRLILYSFRNKTGSDINHSTQYITNTHSYLIGNYT